MQTKPYSQHQLIISCDADTASTNSLVVVMRTRHVGIAQRHIDQGVAAPSRRELMLEGGRWMNDGAAWEKGWIGQYTTLITPLDTLQPAPTH